jgi:3-dehydroquinate dehydratase/shikimate dehydrogenase
LKGREAEVFVVNRTPEKAQSLARQAKAKYVKRADLAKLSFDVIINATPLGMNGNRQMPLEEKELNASYLFDLVYTPAETKLLKLAKAKGLHVIPGLEMFVQQGARQFEIWTGKPAPIAEMGYVVSKALDRQQSQEGAPEDEPLPEEKPAKAAKSVAVKAAPAKSPAPKKTTAIRKPKRVLVKSAAKKTVRR